MKNFLILTALLLTTLSANAQLQKISTGKDKTQPFKMALQDWSNKVESADPAVILAMKKKMETAMVMEIQKKDSNWNPEETRSTNEKSENRRRGGSSNSTGQSTVTRQQEIYQRISEFDLTDRHPRNIAKLDKLMQEFYDTTKEE